MVAAGLVTLRRLKVVESDRVRPRGLVPEQLVASGRSKEGEEGPGGCDLAVPENPVAPKRLKVHDQFVTTYEIQCSRAPRRAVAIESPARAARHAAPGQF